AFSVFQLGIAIWVDSLWLLASLVAAVALIHYVVIPREEQYLERRFGAQYLDYKASVRRWLQAAQPLAGADQRMKGELLSGISWYGGRSAVRSAHKGREESQMRCVRRGHPGARRRP